MKILFLFLVVVAVGVAQIPYSGSYFNNTADVVRWGIFSGDGSGTWDQFAGADVQPGQSLTIEGVMPYQDWLQYYPESRWAAYSLVWAEDDPGHEGEVFRGPEISMLSGGGDGTLVDAATSLVGLDAYSGPKPAGWDEAHPSDTGGGDGSPPTTTAGALTAIDARWEKLKTSVVACLVVFGGIASLGVLILWGERMRPKGVKGGRV